MIRNVINREATRATHRDHGYPTMGVYFGTDVVPASAGVPVSMHRQLLLDTVTILCAFTGKTVTVVDAGQPFWSAPVPQPRAGDYVLYREPDGQDRAALVVIPLYPEGGQVEIMPLDGDGSTLYVTAARIQYDLDALHAEAVKLDARRSAPYTLAVDTRTDGGWRAGRPYSVDTDLSPQQLADQVGGALDGPEEIVVLVWRDGEPVAAGQHGH
jgi:hypothetical protein